MNVPKGRQGDESSLVFAVVDYQQRENTSVVVAIDANGRMLSPLQLQLPYLR